MYASLTEIKNTISNDYTTNSKILVFDFEEANDSNIPDIPNQSKLNEAELDLGIFLFSKVLSSGDEDLFKDFLIKSNQLNTDFFKIIKERKQNEESDQQIIDYLKQELKLIFAKILIPRL